MLEQIRLLSNLETTKDKLLQIILVGQPELGTMLDSYELRQLGQRISLSCRLHPLTYSETKEYIAHRLHVASQKSAAVFSNSAIRRIYKFSGGIPRLINMACDRSLLTAFGCHRLKVSGSVAKSAILELIARGEITHTILKKNAKKLISVAALCAVLFIVLVYYQDLQRLIVKAPSADSLAPVIEVKDEPPGLLVPVPDQKILPLPEIKRPDSFSDKSKSVPVQVSRVAEPAAATKNDTQFIDFQKILIDGNTIFTKNASFELLLKTWNFSANFQQDLNEISDDRAFFHLAAQKSGLIATPVFGNLERIVKLNIPSILKFTHPSGVAPVYLTVIKVTPDVMIFSGYQTLPAIAVPYAWVMENWDGEGFVFWKNFYNYQGIIPLDAPGESVITLKLHLRDIGYHHIDISGTYDLATRMAINAIQARHGIPIDGYVGPLTKIILYNETHSLEIPHLWEPMTIPRDVRDIQKKTTEPEKGLPTPELLDN